MTKSACLADLSAETLLKAEALCLSACIAQTGAGRRWAKRFSIRAQCFPGLANLERVFCELGQSSITKTVLALNQLLPLRVERGESDATLAHRMGEGLGVKVSGEVSKIFR